MGWAGVNCQGGDYGSETVHGFKKAEFEWQTEQGELYVLGRSSEGQGLAVVWLHYTGYTEERDTLKKLKTRWNLSEGSYPLSH